MKRFDQLIQQVEENLKISKSSEFLKASFPEGEILFKEKSLNGTEYLEMHIQIKPKYQGKGIACVKIKELIKQLNKPAYFSHGRILNEQMYKVFEKIKQDADFEVEEDDRGVWVRESN